MLPPSHWNFSWSLVGSVVFLIARAPFALDALQLAITGGWLQPLGATHESLVHGLPSSQFGLPVPTHSSEASHASVTVHALPSLQGSPSASQIPDVRTMNTNGDRWSTVAQMTLVAVLRLEV